jgi:hypothetical protein
MPILSYLHQLFNADTCHAVLYLYAADNSSHAQTR